jgi:trimeric autotransporter adhesin
MTVRARPLPLAALLLAVATAVAVSVALSGPAGAVVSADPDDGTCETNGRVYAVAYLGGTIYLGGSFTSVDGTTRNRLAACDAATGNLLSWNPNANGVVRALEVSPAGTRVYAGGDFTAVGGAARARVAALSPSSGGAFGGEFTQAGGEAHQGLAQFSGTP